jgi:putative membrane protein
MHRSISMRRTLTLAVACGLLATAAFAQTTRTPPTPQSAPARTGATQQPPSAQEFVNKVAISDMFEIESSQLALSKEPDRDTKPFAERMVADHQKTSSELKSLVDGGKVKATLPRALDSEHQGMLDELKGKSGKDFDQSYDQTQVKAHQDAVVLFEAYSRAGDDAELKRWAAKTLPNLKQHLTMAQKLK